MWHTRDGSWFGCVWFGAFFFFFKFLSIFGQRLCFRKVCSVGLYHWKTFLSCSTHMPQARTQQIPAPRKSRAFYLCDWFHFWILFRLGRSVPDVMCWFFRCELPVCWEPRRPLGVGHPQLTDGSDLGHWGCWLDPTRLRRERNHNTS